MQDVLLRVFGFGFEAAGLGLCAFRDIITPDMTYWLTASAYCYDCDYDCDDYDDADDDHDDDDDYYFYYHHDNYHHKH